MPWKQDWEPAVRDHAWLTIFRPTRAGRWVHGARFTAWPVARAVLRKARGQMRMAGLVQRAGGRKES
ncbi:MAG: hypothetical protein NVSMB23_12520 [Myxococcales bacterium]